MANIDPAPSWADIRQLETTDRNLAGPGGVLNTQPTSIAARLNLLRDNATALNNTVAGVSSRQDSADSAIDSLESQVLDAPGTLSDLDHGAPISVTGDQFPDVLSIDNSRGPVLALNESISDLVQRDEWLKYKLDQNIARLLGFAVPADFGVIGDGIVDDTEGLQALLSSQKIIFVPRPIAFYKTTATLNINSQLTLMFQDELTEIRMVSGSGFVIKCDGGQIESFAAKQIRITGGSISGGNPATGQYNADCDGGIHIRGAYMVHIGDFHAKCFAKATARAGLLENVFNTAIRDSRFNCGTSKDDLRGGGGLKITISAGATWNITQVTLNNNLFQFNNGWGIEVTRDGSTGSIDGLTIDNNGIGHNSLGGVGFTSSQIFATSVTRNHIEGNGSFGVSVAESGCVVDVINNKIQDASVAVVHAGIGDVRSNQVTRASLTGDVTKVGFSFTATANVSVGINDIDTNWIMAPANRYTRENGARVTWPVFQTTIANFGTFFASLAQTYHGATLIQTDATDFSTRVLQAYSPTGSGGWYRLVGRFSGVQTIGGATPNVGGGAQVFKTGNASATTMTAMPGGYTGQQLTVLFGDANTTVDFTGTTLKGNSGSDWMPKINDSMLCTFDGTNWICLINITNP